MLSLFRNEAVHTVIFESNEADKPLPRVYGVQTRSSPRTGRLFRADGLHERVPCRKPT